MTQSPNPYASADDTDFFLPDFAPVPMQRKRSRGWAPKNQQLFIAMLAETGSVSIAAQCVGLSARSAYKLREKPGAEAFALAWEDALEIGIGHARDTILERWRNGRVVPRWHRGTIIGYEQKFNERALIAALYSLRREAAGGYWRQRAFREMRLEAAEEDRETARCLASDPEPQATDNIPKNSPAPPPRLRQL